jgi:hypothetical protein
MIRQTVSTGVDTSYLVAGQYQSTIDTNNITAILIFTEYDMCSVFRWVDNQDSQVKIYAY